MEDAAIDRQTLEDPIPPTAREDIGRIGAETLLQNWPRNRLIEISGPTYYSPNDVAAALEQAPDRPVTAIAVLRETWVTLHQVNQNDGAHSGKDTEAGRVGNGRFFAQLGLRLTRRDGDLLKKRRHL
jgi:uncharacterized protein YbjT (DUF2867 family)